MEAAVAAAGAGEQPQARLKMLSLQKEVRIQQTSALPPHRQTFVKAAAGAEVGRIGFYVANLGPSQPNREQIRDELAQRHAHPATIIVICECAAPTFELLAATCEEDIPCCQ